MSAAADLIAESISWQRADDKFPRADAADLIHRLTIALSEGAIDTSPGTPAARTQFRVHYSYGVNSGTYTGSSVQVIVDYICRQTQGSINVDLVEERQVQLIETPWVPVPNARKVRS